MIGMMSGVPTPMWCVVFWVLAVWIPSLAALLMILPAAFWRVGR
jgi:hypothetical protein